MNRAWKPHGEFIATGSFTRRLRLTIGNSPPTGVNYFAGSIDSPFLLPEQERCLTLFARILLDEVPRRTNASNFTRRCTRDAGLLFCWQHVWQPLVALVAFIAFGGGVAELTGFSARDLFGGGPPAPVVTVYFAATEPRSDFLMTRGGRTLMFVSLPALQLPVNRLLFGTALIRPVNTGTRSMTGLELSTIFSQTLWHPSLGDLDKASVVLLTGSHDVALSVKRLGDRCIATRALPRLDPMSGTPFPVSFLLEAHAATPSGSIGDTVEGQIDVRVTGPDWEGLGHVIDVRAVRADTGEEFIAAGRRVAGTFTRAGISRRPGRLRRHARGQRGARGERSHHRSSQYHLLCPPQGTHAV